MYTIFVKQKSFILKFKWILACLMNIHMVLNNWIAVLVRWKIEFVTSYIGNVIVMSYHRLKKQHFRNSLNFLIGSEINWALVPILGCLHFVYEYRSYFRHFTSNLHGFHRNIPFMDRFMCYIENNRWWRKIQMRMSNYFGILRIEYLEMF